MNKEQIESMLEVYERRIKALEEIEDLMIWKEVDAKDVSEEEYEFFCDMFGVFLTRLDLMRVDYEKLASIWDKVYMDEKTENKTN
jgi:hypothetical protein